MSDTPTDRPPTDTTTPELRRAESLVLVNTGDGKGKSSAAFGAMIRSVARGWPVAVVQFLKSGNWNVGEEKVARDLGVDWFAIGEGFTWDSDGPQRGRGRRPGGVATGRRAAGSGQPPPGDPRRDHLPDELGLDRHRRGRRRRSAPGRRKINVVCTGRDAPDALVDIADTATEMR